MFTLGIDLGGTNVKAGLCDGDGKLIKKMSLPTQRDSTADVVTDSMARLCYMLFVCGIAFVPFQPVVWLVKN